MKTAEEWNKIIGDAAEQKGGFDTYDDMEGFIKQIQADAQKHGEQIGWRKGMTDAAEIAEKHLLGNRDFAGRGTKNAILTAIDNKKEV